MEIYTIDYDKVLSACYLTGTASYHEALEFLFPLIDKVDFQRRLQDPRFYSRLEKDLVTGCIMPPITIAFISTDYNKEKHELNKLKEFVIANINNAYILDGIQRLNTLKRASEKEGFDPNRLLYLNIIISPSEDFLLYRMITLNNGQKPMSPRHQIEILTQHIFDFPSLENLTIQTEKEASKVKDNTAIKYADITKAYLGFLSDNVNNDNSKIISEEMDKIVVNRIMEAGLPKDQKFFDYLKQIDFFCKDSYLKNWFCQSNNLIGSIVGMKNHYDFISELTIEAVFLMVSSFEENFKQLVNVSKINLGKTRREYTCELFKKIEKSVNFSDLDMKDFIASLG